jgi:hypothetical protein
VFGKIIVGPLKSQFSLLVPINKLFFTPGLAHKNFWFRPYCKHTLSHPESTHTHHLVELIIGGGTPAIGCALLRFLILLQNSYVEN